MDKPVDQVANQNVTEKSETGPAQPNSAQNSAEQSAAHPKKSRFGIVGVAIRLLIAVGIVITAVAFFQGLVSSQTEPVRRSSFERSYTVSVMDAEAVDFTAQLVSYGEIVAAKTLDVRAQVVAEITYVSPQLQNGGSVLRGDKLLSVDPFDYQLAVDNARDDIVDAQLAALEAQEQVDVQNLNVAFAARQHDVAIADLERAQTLVERGALTNQELESRELVVSQREQSLRQAESTLVLQEALFERRQAAIARQSRALEQAIRTLAITTIYAPFDAIIVSSSAVVGAIVGQNETIASVYDAHALEARFSVSELEFGQLSASNFEGRQVRVVWNIAPEPVVLNGTISRVGAQIDPTLGGVELYAELHNVAETIIRPGTFVSVELPGATFENVLIVPETAVYENDHFYIVTDGKMARVDAEVLLRDGDKVILDAQVVDEARIITTRLAQAGVGLRVTVEGEEPAPGFQTEDDQPGGRAGGPPGGGPNGPPGGR